MKESNNLNHSIVINIYENIEAGPQNTNKTPTRKNSIKFNEKNEQLDYVDSPSNIRRRKVSAKSASSTPSNNILTDSKRYIKKNSETSSIRSMNSTSSNLNSHQKSTHSQDAPEDYRWIAFLVGYLMTITILMDGMFLNSPWYVGVDQDDNKGTDQYKFLSTLHISLFLCLIISTLSFILRCLNFDVYLTTLSCIFFSTINGNDFVGLIYAFSLSVFISVLLIYEVISTKDFKHKGSGMTRSQMKMLSSLQAVYIWSLVESVVLMIALKRPFYEGVYISFVTITTIGFGDLYPQTYITKIFTSFWFIIGIFLTTIYLLYTREVVVQVFTDRYEKKIEEIEKIKKQLNEFKDQQELFEHLEKEMIKKSQYTIKGIYRRAIRFGSNKFSQKEINSAKKHSIRKFHRKEIKLRHKIKTVLDFHNDHSYEATAKRMNIHFCYVFIICMVLFFTVATIFYLIERDHWVYGDAVWFCFVAFTTIGYGDTVLKKKLSLVIFNFVILIAVSIFAAMIGLAVDRFQLYMDHVIDSKKDTIDFYPQKILGQIVSGLTPSDLPDLSIFSKPAKKREKKISKGSIITQEYNSNQLKA
ncbi:hypothetical protein BB561_000934 [Smittium simulii]|uniref:Potassium channel domain-containing protein n=1 Tax=Smittium simulii TaxID=133385 RepID=A0A2T9YWY0_9FUNG|nr:hypothetical protein BB561_000934 [Smittium simulii]